MRNKISLTINGNTNIKLRLSNMSMHLLRKLIKDKTVCKIMNVEKTFGTGAIKYKVVIQEEQRVPLTPKQQDSLLDEWFRRSYKRA